MNSGLSFINVLFFYLSILTTTPPIKTGTIAPDFSLPDSAGNLVTLSSFKGKIVLVDFWASWCRPCRENNRDLVSVYDVFHKRGFEILSVSIDRTKENWLSAIKADALPWKMHVCDYKEYLSVPATLYDIQGIPATYLIDAEGKIIAVNPDAYDVEKKLEKLLKNHVSFYPHHPTDKIYFTEEVQYEIFNSEGKELIVGKGEEADISHLLPGTYHIRYLGRNERFHKTGAAK